MRVPDTIRATAGDAKTDTEMVRDPGRGGGGRSTVSTHNLPARK